MTTTRWDAAPAAGAGITGGFRVRARSLHQALMAWRADLEARRALAVMEDRERSDIGLTRRGLHRSVE